MTANDLPPAKERRRRFYAITQNDDDGTVDVILYIKTFRHTEEGVRQDVSIRVVRGVVPFDGLEEDIRRRWDAWRETGEVIY